MSFSARFFAAGEPYPMGSGFVHNGRYVRQGDAKIRQWQKCVKRAASLHAPDEPINAHFRVSVVFHLSPRWMRRDLDKLARSTFDALTKIVYVDDNRIWRATLEKMEELDGATGATITVEELPC